MKKWNEYSRSEKGMIITLVVMLIAVLLSWGRVSTGFQKGMNLFYGVSVDTVGHK